jgi:hypothetical protein
MALSVKKLPASKKLTVTNNVGGMQNTHNPQQAAPVKYVQPAAPAKTVQPAATRKTYQPAATGRVVQPAVTAAQVAAAAETVRQAAEVQAARVREARRVQVQGDVNTRIASNAAKLSLSVRSAPATGSLKVSNKWSSPRIKVPQLTDEQQEFERIRAEARKSAEKAVDYLKSDGGVNGFWGRLGDKLTFGTDRRAGDARKYAEDRAKYIEETQIKKYQDKLDEHNNLEARLKSDFEAKRLTIKSDAELQRLADDYNVQLTNSLKAVNYMAAATTGTLEGYGIKAQEKLKSAPAKAARWFNTNVLQMQTPLLKYTLGAGSENIPSLFTLPSRLVNTVGNLNTKDRTINQYGGESMNRVNSSKNAWQASFNQRNMNIKPVIDRPYDRKTAEAEFKKSSQYIMETKYGSWDKKSDSEKEKLIRKHWDFLNKQRRDANSMQEFGADPVNFIPILGQIKHAGVVGKLDDIGRASRATSWAFKAADKISDAKKALGIKVSQNKFVQWAGKEYKTAEQQLSEAIESAKTTQKSAQSTFLPKINAINKKLRTGEKLDVSVLDDLATLTDSEAKMLQRMHGGKLTARDRLMLAGKNMAPVRAKLETLSARWDEFVEQMRLADNVSTTRFGRGKRTYSPRTVWFSRKGKSLDDYNFRLKKKNFAPQSAADFQQGAIDRYFKSDLDNAFAKKQTTKQAKLAAEKADLLKQYDDMVLPQRNAVEAAYNRTRSPWNKVKRAVKAPTRFWKHSVLGRPAWTANNAIHNTIVGAIATNGGSLVEQAKMVNPRYWRKAMDEARSIAGSDIGKEFPKSPSRNPVSWALNKWYGANTGVEDWSRVATYRSLKKKGFNSDRALNETNKYLFNYTTKNWERPLKTIFPFWSWNKNISKAAIRMPYDKPLAAGAYNRLDRHTTEKFRQEFEQMVPALLEQGYTEEEIETMKAEAEKFYGGKLMTGRDKNGNPQFMNTPFNAFSKDGLARFGANPFLAALGEFANSTDSWGTTVKASESNLWRRLSSKFPQYELGRQWIKSKRVDKGLDRPTEKYIGEAGSDGYGLTKEKQGFDKSKPNYVESMDPRKKLGQNALAFLGVPRSLTFDKPTFIDRKKLQKIKTEYFATDWESMEFEDRIKQQQALFDKFGITADHFYKSELAKYDTEHTKSIKAQKEEARLLNGALFAEYGRQPIGTRKVWATQKLRELQKSDYFKNNPFLESFDWLKPSMIESADKTVAYHKAKASGDWRAYNAQFGKKAPTAKALAWQEATRTGDWTKYRKAHGVKETAKSRAFKKATTSGDWTKYREEFGTKSSPYQVDGKYFKSAESMARYQEGKFWEKYASAGKEARKQLLADNPKYNQRADWTNEQWDTWKKEKRAAERGRLASWSTASVSINKFIAENAKSSATFNRKREGGKRTKKISWLR